MKRCSQPLCYRFYFLSVCLLVYPYTQPKNYHWIWVTFSHKVGPVRGGGEGIVIRFICLSVCFFCPFTQPESNTSDLDHIFTQGWVYLSQIQIFFFFFFLQILMGEGLCVLRHWLSFNYNSTHYTGII